MSSKFVWGKVIDRHTYDFENGNVFEVTKYNPYKRNSREIDYDVIRFSCEETHEYSDNLMHLLISWIVIKHLGYNQDALTAGICRALKLSGV